MAKMAYARTLSAFLQFFFFYKKRHQQTKQNTRHNIYFGLVYAIKNLYLIFIKQKMWTQPTLIY